MAALKFPEHEKMKEVQAKSQAIGEFLEWLRTEKQLFLSREVEIAKRWNGDPITEWLPQHPDLERLLAEFFEIDLAKIEQEKRQMLDELRRANE